ncbi:MULTISPECIES: DUF3846 domain-containing protein [Bacillus cereus group]|uniref:DUF3846 domain-containing protein n=1 Tax=Bacillus thuringiensis TaxID=1428 RepID=A0A9X6WGR8_BACTU|nr:MULTISPECIES: DUF3846 domain-containing protein [Bacillus cereus group]PFJ25978.1 hypothetical protein COJ15_35260 [Bacillus thuringiensis]PGP11564.1 hypothetical protein COA01_35495 [Bacillus cereus]
MKVVVFEPQKQPYVAQIEESLNGYKQAVGEELSFHPIQMDDGTVFQLIANDQAVLHNLPKNRRLYRGDTEYDMVRGTFIIVQLNEIGDESISMDEQYIEFIISNDFEWATEDDIDPIISSFNF